MGLYNGLMKRKVMILGDVIADIYKFGIITRISREAPIPVVELKEEKIIPGGAGNVAANISSLQGEAYPVGVLGEDDVGDRIIGVLQMMGVNTSGLLRYGAINTSSKTRILAQGEHTIRQQLLRLDKLPVKTLAEEILTDLWNTCLRMLKETEAVIISDYHLNVLPEVFLLDFSNQALKMGKKVIVDSRHRILKYRNVTLLTPNRAEAEEATGIQVRDSRSLNWAAEKILEQTFAKYLLITLGDEGMALFDSDGMIEKIPAFNRLEVFDVSGAGDTVIAAITLGLLNGMEPLMAARFANVAAGLVVRKLGTATVSLEEVMEVFGEQVTLLIDEIIS